MRKIWKFPLSIGDFQTIEMPKCAEILAVKAQYGNPSLWAICNPEKELEARCFRVVGTGEPFPESNATEHYLGTVLMNDDQLVLHVFEIGRPRL